MVTWQWTSSGPAPDCFNTTTVTYRPEGGGESFLQLSNPAATEAILTGLQCNTNYAITVVATAGGHRRTQGIHMEDCLDSRIMKSCFDLAGTRSMCPTGMFS